MWTPLDSQDAIAKLLDQFGEFQDACLREISVATETFVGERGGMSCPGHLDTSALLFFQSQGSRVPAMEMRCTGVAKLGLQPTGENRDSIISSGRVSLDEEWCRLTVSFVGGPLTGPPNTGAWLPATSSREPDLEIVARSIEWRPVSDGLGDRLRYRPVA